jgi:hypothetical protein
LRTTPSDELATAYVEAGHPMQALNLQTASHDAPIDFRVAEVLRCGELTL